MSNLIDANDTLDYDVTNAELDEEIGSLRQQVLYLKAQRSLQVSTILSSHSTLTTLNQIHDQRTSTDAGDLDSLFSTINLQNKIRQANLYRLCATITSFRVQDPDPNAVGDGNILALRFDVSNDGRFIRPYYVMLNKPWEGERNMLLNIHQHTLPPAIPLTSLVEKYLPSGEDIISNGDQNNRVPPKQSLKLFSRALRRSIIAYHNRLSTINNLRIEFGLNVNKTRNRKVQEEFLMDISATDAEIKQIRLEWYDGRVGRIVVDEDGDIIKCVILNENGRDRATEKAICGNLIELDRKLRDNYNRKIRSPSTEEFTD